MFLLRNVYFTDFIITYQISFVVSFVVFFVAAFVKVCFFGLYHKSK